jgi:phosphotransferase system HPr (HPr) family protein
MRRLTHVLVDPLGLHARPAVALATTVREQGCSVVAEVGGRVVDATDPMALMALDVRCGDVLSLEVVGDDEDAAVRALEGALEGV